MDYSEAKNSFIEAWGALGLAWGINKTMAQIFALLLISPDPLSVEKIMEDLQVSRGNCSMNLRALIDWGLIQKTVKRGERREYFTTNQSFWDIAKIVAYERSKRELDPLTNVLQQVKGLESTQAQRETLYFIKKMEEINKVVQTLDLILKTFVKSDSNWVLNNVTNLIKKGNT